MTGEIPTLQGTLSPETEWKQDFLGTVTFRGGGREDIELTHAGGASCADSL
jgi:hypothetical protein